MLEKLNIIKYYIMIFIKIYMIIFYLINKYIQKKIYINNNYDIYKKYY